MLNILYLYMDYKKLIIRGISYSQTQSGAYALLLEDEETSIKLPVVIGNFEAQSISLGLEKDINPPRPLTHDLFTSFVLRAQYTLSSVVIYQILDGVFFSNLYFNQKETGHEIVIDARTSDAVAMAVRFDAPIYTTSQVLNEAGILLELDETSQSNSLDDEEEDFDNGSEILLNDLSNLSHEDLQSLLDNAVANEDYDTALEIQEEIKRRRKKID